MPIKKIEKTQKLKLKTKEWKSRMIHANVKDEKKIMQIIILFISFSQVALFDVITISMCRKENKLNGRKEYWPDLPWAPFALSHLLRN